MGAVSRNAVDKRRHKAKRTAPVLNKDAFSEHISQIGEVIYLWNRVQDNLFMIFWGLIDSSNHAKAYEIWHSIQSDSTQRQMVERLASIELKPRLCSHVLWICRAHAMLAPYRNAFAHVGFYYDLVSDSGYIPIDTSARKQALERLSAAPKADLFKKLRGDLAALDNYASDIGLRVFYKLNRSASPWMERPELQLVPKARKRRTKVSPTYQD